MPHRFSRPTHISAFRTLAAVSWDAPRDPTTYGSEDVDVTELLAWLQAVTVRTGQKVTPTHAVARAFAATLAEYPDLNCTIRRGRLWQRKDVDVFLQVAVPHEEGNKLQGADLSGAVLRHADRLDTAGIARELSEKAERIRKRDDPMLARTKNNLKWMPPFLGRFMMRALVWLTHDLGLNLEGLGVPTDAFGSLQVTSIGKFAIRHAFAPLFPAARGIGVVVVGAVFDGVAVVDGEVKVRKLLPLSMALDHRLIDGYQASVLSRGVLERLTHPERLDVPVQAEVG